MKIVTAAEMKRIEERAYADKGADLAASFMEEAGRQIARRVQRYLEDAGGRPQRRRIYLLCGKGNNAGDALVAGRYLLSAGYGVHALCLHAATEVSPLCGKNLELFRTAGGEISLVAGGTISSFTHPGLILDGILGSGFNGTAPLPPAYSRLIAQANASGLPIIAIDLPSGLKEAAETSPLLPYRPDEVIFAALTLSLGLPKNRFFYHQAWDAVGRLEVLDFGLEKKYLAEAVSDLELIDASLVAPLLPKLRPTRHKYEAGMLAVCAGTSAGMAGSGIMACTAALRSGCGLVQWFHPATRANEREGKPLEVIVRATKGLSFSAEHKALLQRSQACLVGPGIGLTAASRKLLAQVLASSKAAMVLDADALTLYGEKPFSLPKDTILTPHRGELQRLLRRNEKPDLSPSFLQSLQQWVDTRGVTLILKGMPTYILHPGTKIHCSAQGNPGMATAGSGDVLAGIVAALRAQGLGPHEAALLGVYLHGRAGDLAAERGSPYSLIATDIIAELGRVFLALLKR
jgi:NAD(P)H-hydrate epimerase